MKKRNISGEYCRVWCWYLAGTVMYIFGFCWKDEFLPSKTQNLILFMCMAKTRLWKYQLKKIRNVGKQGCTEKDYYEVYLFGRLFFGDIAGVKPDIYSRYIPNLSTPCITPWSFMLQQEVMRGELMFDGPRKFYWKTHEAFQTMEIHHSQWIFLYFCALFGTFALIHPFPFLHFRCAGTRGYLCILCYFNFCGYVDKSRLFRGQIFLLFLTNAKV